MHPEPRPGPTRRRTALLLLLLLPLLGALGAAGLRLRRMATALTHPPRAQAAPAQAELEGAEAVTFRSDDGVPLRGSYVPSRTGAAVVLCHGFGEARAQLHFEARALAAAGLGVMRFDFRGHGESGDAAVTWGDRERRDLAAALVWVRARPDVDGARVGVFGFSMGGTTALLVAQGDAGVRAVAAAGAYPTLEGDLRTRYGAWTGPLLAALRRAGVDVDAVRPLDGMCRLGGRPVLLVNSSVDPDAPAKGGGSLYRAACAPRTLRVFEGREHGGYARSAPDAYAALLRDFFGAALGTGAAGAPAP